MCIKEGFLHRENFVRFLFIFFPIFLHFFLFLGINDCKETLHTDYSLKLFPLNSFAIFTLFVAIFIIIPSLLRSMFYYVRGSSNSKLCWMEVFVIPFLGEFKTKTANTLFKRSQLCYNICHIKIIPTNIKWCQ